MGSKVTQIEIPGHLLPADGRFGSGPTKVRPEAIKALIGTGNSYLGTSHRRPAVKEMVARARSGLDALFGLPEGYEVVLGVGGASAFWDVATLNLIDRRSEHLVFGEFSGKFARSVALVPFLESPLVVTAEPGTCPEVVAAPDVDVYALTHNETSTGVLAPVKRPDGPGLVVVDGTSAAGAIVVDPAQFDAYYFSLQKAFASDGGLWFALLSPDAVGRASADRDRYIPPFLDLRAAIENSRNDQTVNTPALVTLFLLVQQVEWINEQGGLAWSAGRAASNAGMVYEWAESVAYATPFVTEPDRRSTTTATIDFVDVDAAALAATLRHNGVVDVEPYRKLGRNQLRIGTWPSIPEEDVAALIACIEYVVGEL